MPIIIIRIDTIVDVCFVATDIRTSAHSTKHPIQRSGNKDDLQI